MFMRNLRFVSRRIYDPRSRLTARFFTENRHVAWTVLVTVALWGVYGYATMPKRKDPDIPVRVAVALTPWPGVSAAKVEQLVTRTVEQTMAKSQWVRQPGAYDYGIRSLTLDGLSIVWVQLDERVKLTKQEFDNINLKLKGITDLPEGAGPIQFNGDFGDTAALMLTVASPKESEVAISLRARTIAHAIQQARAQFLPSQQGARASLVVAFPLSINSSIPQRIRDLLVRFMIDQNFAREIQPLQGAGFIGLDVLTEADDTRILAFVERFRWQQLQAEEFHPDVWQPIVIRDPQETAVKLAAAAGAKYSYRELDEFTDFIQRALQSVPQVAKVDRSGVLPEQVLLEYSQERLASYGVQPSQIGQILEARNSTLPGGMLAIGGQNLRIDPSSEFRQIEEIGDVLIPTSGWVPLYLRDLVAIERGYQNPPRYLNFYTTRDASGASSNQ